MTSVFPVERHDISGSDFASSYDYCMVSRFIPYVSLKQKLYFIDAGYAHIG